MKTTLVGLLLTVWPLSVSAANNAPAKATTAEPAPPPATFTPPYPQRENPFERPDAPRAGGANAVAPHINADVRLKGFVNVDGVVKAILAINGQFAALGEGGRRDDLQVVKIRPPEVSLQRGRSRWTVTLFSVAEPAEDDAADDETTEAGNPAAEQNGQDVGVDSSRSYGPHGR